MMSLALMMTDLPSDVALLMLWGKLRIISGVAEYIIFAKQMHHIAVGDASFHLATPPLLCYNTSKAVILWKLKRNANLILILLEH